MKILILSCNMGEGHNTAGKAVHEAFTRRGIDCEFADTLAIAGQKVSRTVNRTYVGITTSSPPVFGWVYSIGRAVSDLNTQRLHCKSPVYAANVLYRRKLAAYIRDGGYDVVILPHLFPAECMTSLRANHMLNTPFINIATDYTCIPFWEETTPDYFVIPHKDLAEDFSSKRIPPETLLPFGIPVSARFAETTDKQEARRQLGLPGDATILLIMSGSMGFGHLEKVIAALQRKFGSGAKEVVLCGRNDALRRTLTQTFADNDDVILLPFTDKVALFMDAADMVFTKPGGLTSTEAAVKHTLLVHTAPIPGCETINARFFAEHGLSVGCTDPTDYDGLAEAAFALWQNPQAQETMLQAQRKHINPRAAEDICDFILEHFGR